MEDDEDEMREDEEEETGGAEEEEEATKGTEEEEEEPSGGAHKIVREYDGWSSVSTPPPMFLAYAKMAYVTPVLTFAGVGIPNPWVEIPPQFAATPGSRGLLAVVLPIEVMVPRMGTEPFNSSRKNSTSRA